MLHEESGNIGKAIVDFVKREGMHFIRLAKVDIHYIFMGTRGLPGVQHALLYL